MNSVEQVHEVVIVNKSSITEKPTWVTYKQQREITNTNDDMEFEETFSTEPIMTTSKAVEYPKETLTTEKTTNKDLESYQTILTEPTSVLNNSMESMKTSLKVPDNTTELDIDKDILSTTLTKSDEEVKEENSTIFSGSTLDFETTSVKSENTSESLIQELFQAGELEIPTTSSQSQIDHSSSGIEDNTVEKMIKTLTTTSQKTGEEYINQSTFSITEGNVATVEQYFTAKQDSADSDDTENTFENKNENELLSMGSEITTESMSYSELLSPSSNSEKGVSTFSPDNSEKREDVLSSLDVNKIALSSYPEYTSDFEIETMASTTIEEDDSGPGHLSEFEIESNAGSEFLTSLSKLIETEDKKTDEIFKQVQNTSQVVNGQKAQYVEEQEKYSDKIDKTLQTLIDPLNSTFLPEPIVNSSGALDEMNPPDTILPKEIFEDITRIEMNQIVDDDRLWNTTKIAENLIEEHFINSEAVYDCLENITCISEFYDDANLSFKDQLDVRFNETDIFDEESTNEYTFEDENTMKEYDELSMSGINNETDYLDMDSETISESYSRLGLYDEEAVGENRTHLAESAQIISHKVA